MSSLGEASHLQLASLMLTMLTAATVQMRMIRTDAVRMRKMTMSSTISDQRRFDTTELGLE